MYVHFTDFSRVFVAGEGYFVCNVYCQTRRDGGVPESTPAGAQVSSRTEVCLLLVYPRGRTTGQTFLRFCGRLGPQTVKVLLALGTYHPFHLRFFLRMHVVLDNCASHSTPGRIEVVVHGFVVFVGSG